MTIKAAMTATDRKIRNMTTRKAAPFVDKLVDTYGTEAVYEELMDGFYRHIYQYMLRA